MAHSMLKYYKTVICLSAFMLAAIGGFAHNGNEIARKAVFDGIELPIFADVSAETHNCLMLGSADFKICTEPVKLHFSADADIRASEPKEQNAPTCAQFALSVPTISNAVRERKQLAESQRNDLESSFVDDGKNHRDGEKIKNASMLLLGGLLYFTLGELIGDNDDNGIYDLYEQDKSF